MTEKKSSRLVPAIMLSFGALVCLWVAATMVGALHQANWQVSELARQYMLARTLAISFGVTLLTVLIGYPLAYAITVAPPSLAN